MDGVDSEAAHPAHNRLDSALRNPHTHRLGYEFLPMEFYNDEEDEVD